MIIGFSLINLNAIPLEGSNRVNNITITEVTITAKRIEYKQYDAQIMAESRGIHMKNGKLLTSPAGAVGIAQFMPGTWKWMKRKGLIPKTFNIRSKHDQLIAHTIFMNYLQSIDYGINDDKYILALASYNAGSGRVRKTIKKYGKEWRNHLPKETRKYIKYILNRIN